MSGEIVMKILYFTQFYKPENIAASFRATDNARYWSDFGHEVTVFTGYPNYPTGKIFDGFIPKLFSEEKDGDVRVIRSKLIAKPNVNFKGRIVNMFSYFFFGLINVLFNRKIGKNYDVVLGTSGTILNAFLAWIYAFIHRKKFIFEIRDITYMQMIAVGKSEKSLVVNIIKRLELFLCRKAKRVVVVTNGFKTVLRHEGISSDKIVVLTNGVDIVKKEAVKSNNIENNFVISYFGTLGISQNIPETFKYIESIKELCANVKYLIIGEGADKQTIINTVKDKKYDFVTIMPGMNSFELEKYYQESDMSIVTLKKDKRFRYTIPSKIFQSMGRGIPLLYIGPEGEAAEIIKKYNVGLALTGTYEQDIIVLKEFFEKDVFEKISEMGQNGYKYADLYYNREKIAQKYIEVLKA